MKNELQQRMPDWCVNDLKLERDLILTNDIDSLMSAILLQVLTNYLWRINYFYDFMSIYRHKKTGNITIGIDAAFTKNVRTFDNHYTIHNKASANMNRIKGIGRNEYCKKYPFSTIMLIMAYYDIPMPTSPTGREIILAIDSSFKGFYTTNDYYKKIYLNWLEEMGYTSLIDILNQRDKDYFYKLQDDYGLNEKIEIDEQGYLYTKINFNDIQPHFNDFKIELPQQRFQHLRTFQTAAHKIGEKPIPSKDKLISLAYTYKNWVCYTYKNDDEAGAE